MFDIIECGGFYYGIVDYILKYQVVVWFKGVVEVVGLFIIVGQVVYFFDVVGIWLFFCWFIVENFWQVGYFQCIWYVCSEGGVNDSGVYVLVFYYIQYSGYQFFCFLGDGVVWFYNDFQFGVFVEFL